MKTEKIIGILLIAGAVGVLIPYSILATTFDYPDILRKNAGFVLTKFYEGGSALIATWWAFAILGVPLLIAYILIGQLLESKFRFLRWVTILGIISGIAQIIGLLRWVFVVPVLAENYVHSDSTASKDAIVVVFKTVHQFGGVLLGEHIGQLFTIIWTFMISLALFKLVQFPKWISWMGIVASIVYLFAQADLFATVIPGFPVWNLAGLIGSTLWLLWLIAIGFCFFRSNNELILV